MKSLLFIYLLFISSFPAFAQNPIGLQQIVNFSAAEYKGGTQNWDIQQDKRGLMYFANNEGLLSYNGQNWKLYSIPSKTVVHSVEVEEDGRIYIGAQNDMGYFQPDNRGVLIYTSLKALLPLKEGMFSDVWSIIPFQGKLFFRTTGKLFEFNKSSFITYTSTPGWLYLGSCQQRLFAQEKVNQLMEYDHQRWKLVCTLPGKALVTAILPYDKDRMLVATLKDGMFLLHGNHLEKLITSIDLKLSLVRINTVKVISEDLYAIGSAFGGCFILDHTGKLIQNFSSSQTLQKNNVRSLYSDQHKNIWLGLDDGISFIAYDSQIKQIYPDPDKQSSTYAVRVFNKALFVGTSDAVFKIDLSNTIKDLSLTNGLFHEVPSTKGQVWNLNEVNSHLLLGNEDGTYAIDAPPSRQIIQYPGTWIYKAFPSEKESADILAGTYLGLHLITYKNNVFTDKGKLNGPDESLRFLTIEGHHNLVWSSNPYRGVYKIVLSPDHKAVLRTLLYTEKDGLPSTLHNYVFTLRGRNIVSTEKGIYEFDFKKDRFYRSPQFWPLFKEQEIQYLNEDRKGNIWFISNKKVGVIDFTRRRGDDNFTTVYFPELTTKVLAGFENIYPLDNQNIFIGANRGVFHLNYEKYLNSIHPPDILLAQVKIIGDKDSLLFGGYPVPLSGIVKLAHINNSLHFDYSSTLFEQRNNVEFSYQLMGFDRKWSGWSAKSEKEFTNLNSGTYTFMVKSRTNLGNESAPLSYSFEIEPAWYQSGWAYAGYFLLLGTAVFSIFKRQQLRHKKIELQLIYLHQLELDQQDKKIVSLKNDQLEADVSFKNKELATTTMHLMQRGKLMSRIRDGLTFIKESDEKNRDHELAKLLKLIHESERNDSDWDHFAIHFDQIHTDFLATLKSKFPGLSPTDLKICAYLKMNLVSKEIAQLMNVTIGAVEVSRYRLRKKLNLPPNVNLFDYLIQATSKTLLNTTDQVIQPEPVSS